MGNAKAYPLFVDLTGRSVAVIGGGEVAVRKTASFLEAGAQVKVVAPQVVAALEELASAGRIEWVAREYRSGDLSGCCLAVCACGDAEAAVRAREEARSEKCLINLADDPGRSDFTVPATLTRGPLQLAVSTSGCAPGLARVVKEDLARVYDEGWGDYVKLFGQVRSLVLERIEDRGHRRTILDGLARSGMRERMEAGEAFDAERAYAAFVLPLLEERKG